MKTVYMHQLYMGVVGDIKNLEHHYSRMAEQGWMIDKIGVFTHRYYAIEPCKKSFFVDYLPQITAFDYPENEDAQDYRSFCEASGWEFVAANRQYQVFCADGNTPSPTPIHTDNTIQARIYLKACQKYELPLFIFSLFMLWFSSPLSRGIDLFLSNIMLFMTIGYGFFLVGFLWTLGFVIRWYLRTRISVKRNLPMPVVNYRLAKVRNNVFAAGIILFIACAALGVVLDIIGGMPVVIFFAVFLPLSGLAVGLWIQRQIDTKKRTRGANIRMFIAALVVIELVFAIGMGFVVRGLIRTPLYKDSLDDRPALMLRDFGMVAETKNAMIKGSAAVPTNYSYWEVTKGGSVHTEVYRSVSNTLSQKLYEHFAVDFEEQYERFDIIHLNPGDTAVWGADEGIIAVYLDHTVELLLLREKTILRLSLSIEGLSDEEAGKAVQELW